MSELLVASSKCLCLVELLSNQKDCMENYLVSFFISFCFVLFSFLEYGGFVNKVMNKMICLASDYHLSIPQMLQKKLLNK